MQKRSFFFGRSFMEVGAHRRCQFAVRVTSTSRGLKKRSFSCARSPVLWLLGLARLMNIRQHLKAQLATNLSSRPAIGCAAVYHLLVMSHLNFDFERRGAGSRIIRPAAYSWSLTVAHSDSLSATGSAATGNLVSLIFHGRWCG